MGLSFCHTLYTYLSLHCLGSWNTGITCYDLIFDLRGMRIMVCISPVYPIPPVSPISPISPVSPISPISPVSPIPPTLLYPYSCYTHLLS